MIAEYSTTPKICPVDGPCEQNDTIVFALASDVPPINSEEFELKNALKQIREYVHLKHLEGAKLIAVHPDLAHHVREEGNWQLAIPNFTTQFTSLSAVHIFQLASDSDANEFLPLLKRDEQIAYAQHPAIRYPRAKKAAKLGGEPDQWGLEKSKFHKIWTDLDVGCTPGPIAIIDQGRDAGHAELAGRIKKYVGPSTGDPSDSGHAGAVAAIICAIRDHSDTDAMKGCCSAEIYLYSPWDIDEKFDVCAYYRALRAVAECRFPVLNLSMGGKCEDSAEREHVGVCITQGHHGGCDRERRR
jgi:hypothetical protein